MEEIKHVVNNTENSKKTYISNYDNVYISNDGIHLVYSPKNKRYTLSIGIMNSQNEFLDITDTLCRWKSGLLIDTVKENPSKLYKFNRGYFITENKPSNLDEAINDANFIKKRQVLPVNTYAYKLIGPMYLKVDYNHILSFSYSITGSKSEDANSANLTITGYITYNCPDKNTSSSINSSLLNYYTLEEDSVSELLNGFDFFRYIIPEGKSVGIAESLECDEVEYSKPIYNENTDTYSVKIIKRYLNVLATRDEHYLDYVIAAGEKDIYLRGLTETGTLDLNLLGSGYNAINNWRFETNWDRKEVTVRFSLEAYPKEDEVYKNIKVSFGLNNSLTIEDFNFGSIIMTFRNQELLKFYEALISWDIYDAKTGEVKESNHIYNDGNVYWILTTTLFNDCYLESSPNFIKNYANPTTGKEQLIMLDKQTIKPSYKVSYKDNSGNINSYTTGSLLKTENVDAFMSYVQSKNINLDITLTVDPVNKLLYPDYLEWTDSFTGSNLHISDIKTNIETYGVIAGINKLILDSNNRAGNYHIDNKTYAEFINSSYSNGSIKGTLNWYDWYYAPTKIFTGTIENGFDTLEHYLEKIKANKNTYVSYSGFTSDGKNLNTSDEHYIYFIKNYPTEYFLYSRIHDDSEEAKEKYLYYIEVKSWTADNELSSGGLHSETSTNSSIRKHRINFDYSNTLNSDNSRALFAYLYWNPIDSTQNLKYWYVTDWGNWDKTEASRSVRNPETWSSTRAKSAYKRSRFMWKNSENNWAYVDGFFPDFNDPIIGTRKDVFDLFAENFLGTTPENIIICRYKELRCDDGSYNLFVANKVNEEIGVNYNYLIKISFKPDLSNFVVDNSNNRVLRFLALSSEEYSEIPLYTINKDSSRLGDYVDQFSSSYLKNLDINTGILVDNSGKELVASQVYVNNNGFKPWLGSPIKMVSVNNSDSEYELRCIALDFHDNIEDQLSSYKMDCCTPRHHSGGDAGQGESSDSFTFINYDSVYKISLDKFKYNG